MKKLILVGLILLVSLPMLNSCNRDSIDIGGEQASAELSFNLENLNLKNKFDGVKTSNKNSYTKSNGDVIDYPLCSTADPAYVEAVIHQGSQSAHTYTLNFTQLLGSNGMPNITETIKLTAGDYSLDSFTVFDASGVAIYEGVASGSDEETSGLTAVPFNFTLAPFEKTPINVDVVCYNEATYETLAWGWYELGYFQRNELAFFGDVCTKFYSSFGAANHDFVAAFRVDIYKGDTIVATANNYGGDPTVFVGITGVPGVPVIVSYLDDLNDPDEDFSFTLTLNTPEGELVLVDKEPITDGAFSEGGNPNNFGGSDGIFDFYVGNCGVGADATYAPYFPLPDEVTFNVNGTTYGNGYVNLTIEDGGNTVMPNGDYPGWCIQEHNTIAKKDSHTAKVHSSLNSADIPAAYSSYPFGKLNWILNHRNGYSNEEVQQAIWELTNGTVTTLAGAGELVTLSNTHAGYMPSVGGYAIVILDPNDGTNTTVQSFAIRIDP